MSSSTSPSDGAALLVLARYPPPLCHGKLNALGNRGGFSGARLWRVEGPCGRLCLRAWPPGDPSRERLTTIHQLISAACQAGLEFVPAVYQTLAGLTWVEHAGRLWDLTPWMPGLADFHVHPTRTRLETACMSLARLHNAWAAISPGQGPSRSLRRRWELIEEWTTLRSTGWQPHFESAGGDVVGPWAERAWTILGRQLGSMRRVLEPWVPRTWPLQPCLGDVWHDHLLFEGDRLTGLIDYGGVKRDHVAVDLARLLGSLVGDDVARRASGVQAYRRVRQLTDEEEALAAVLDQSGTLLGAANWVKWIYVEKRTFEDQQAVARRLAELVRRIEAW